MTQNKYKILLVEDESNIRNLVTTMLETGGYQVIYAGTCATAKAMFSSYLPDLVILDLGLPDEDGMAFLEHIRKDSLTPVIVLSARVEESDKVLALDSGANDYVTKPFSAGELLARVRTALRNNRFSSPEGRLPGGRFVLKDLQIDYDARQVYIGKNEISAWKIRSGEGDAHVDDHPFALVCGAIAIHGQIHPDFTNAAQRQEHELCLIGICHLYSLQPAIRHLPMQLLRNEHRRQQSSPVPHHYRV